MSKIWKKGLALVLCVAMAIGLCVTTFAGPNPKNEYCHTHGWEPIKVTKQVCNYEGCDAYFDTAEEVWDHIVLVHDGHASYSSAKVTIGWKCATCGMETTNTDPADNPIGTEHTWDNGTVTVEPTCEDEGQMTYTCTACGDSYTESIPALGHTWDEGKITTEPTCTEDGIVTYTCERCGKTMNDPVDAKGHSYDEGKVTTEPTCTTDGIKTYTCSNCGDSYTEVIPAFGHDYQEGKITREPTCTEEGVKTYTCTVCGDTKTESIPALGHSWDEGKVTTEPTCTEEGVKQG